MFLSKEVFLVKGKIYISVIFFLDSIMDDLISSIEVVSEFVGSKLMEEVLFEFVKF